MNQVEAGRKENEILGKRLTVAYVVLMNSVYKLIHDTIKAIANTKDKVLFEKTEPLIDNCWNIINNKELKSNVKIKAAKIISAWTKVIDEIVIYKGEIQYEEMLNFLGQAFTPLSNLTFFIHDEYSDLVERMMDEWDCWEDIKTAHKEYCKVVSKSGEPELQVIMLTLRLCEKIFEHLEGEIDKTYIKEDENGK